MKGFVKMENELLRLENITFSYDEDEVIHNINLSIYKKQKVAILGNNGAGKSTLFLLCNGVLSQNNGNIYYNGNIIGKKRKDINFLREKVGLVFQDADNQIIASTVFSEISFGPMNLGKSKDEVKEKVEKSLKAMNLEKMRNKPPHYLSGGEKKRVTIADMLAMESEIILFDEPTASLDPKNVVELKTILDNLHQEGRTLVVSTHDIDFAYEWADRIIVMNEGKIICDDIPEKVFMQKDIIKKASLREPYMFTTGEILKNKKIIKDKSVFIKTPLELNSIIKYDLT